VCLNYVQIKIQIRKKLVIFFHVKGFDISQKPKSSPLSYFAQKISLNLAPFVQLSLKLMEFLLLIVYGKEIHLKTNMYSHLSKVLGNVKKYPYLINQNHIFFKKYES
jgi:hypothetical protein